MKFKWDKKYTTIAVYALIVIMLAVLFVVFVFKFDSIAKGFSWIGAVAAPLICGLVAAYILNPLMMWIERKFFGRLISDSLPKSKTVMERIADTKAGNFKAVKELEQRTDLPENRIRRRRIAARALSVALTYIIMLAILVGTCVLIVPSVSQSIMTLADQMPGYIHKLDIYLQENVAKNNWLADIISDSFLELSEIIHKIKDYIEPMVENIASGVWSFASGVIIGLKNFVIGLIIAIYLLFSKERLLAQCKKILFAFFKNSTCQRFFYFARKSNHIFNKYLISNLIDSLIIFAAMAIGMAILGMPYPLLISVVCGITNLIPFFGPFIGAIPCGLLILLVDPVKVIWFGIYVLILQQLDGNVIKPYLFGETMGLPAIWVLVSITVGGGLFGIPGMLLGAPVFAVLYLLFAELVSNKLKKKNMPSATAEYFSDVSEYVDGYGQDDLPADDNSEIPDSKELLQSAQSAAPEKPAPQKNTNSPQKSRRNRK